MLIWLWKRIKARFSDEHVLDIMEWELKPALEQIMYHLSQTGDFLLYYHYSDGVYVRSRPGNMLQIDTPVGSINITILDGYYLSARTFDDRYMRSHESDVFDEECIAMLSEYYRLVVDPVGDLIAAA